MAFKASGLTKIANLLALVASTDPTPGLFYYSTTDTLATVMGAGYFNLATTLIEGSVIELFASNIKATLYVTGVSAGVVSVSNTATSARGQATTVTASDNIATGLAGPLLGVIASFNDDPGLTYDLVTASIGDQAGAPASGHFLLKTWEPTDATHTTPIAATTFGKKVNWFAWSA